MLSLTSLFGVRPRSELITSWEALRPLAADWDRLWQAGERSRPLCLAHRWVEAITARQRRRARDSLVDPLASRVTLPRDRPCGAAEHGGPGQAVEELLGWGRLVTGVTRGVRGAPPDGLGRAEEDRREGRKEERNALSARVPQCDGAVRAEGVLIPGIRRVPDRIPAQETAGRRVVVAGY